MSCRSMQALSCFSDNLTYHSIFRFIVFSVLWVVFFNDVCLVFFFFFFQAEDGIRDLYVTGVQTCALPIFHQTLQRLLGGFRNPLARFLCVPVQRPFRGLQTIQAISSLLLGARSLRYRGLRSEERRVGKEGGRGGWRGRWCGCGEGTEELCC